jgi:hypothetical protein
MELQSSAGAQDQAQAMAVQVKTAKNQLNQSPRYQILDQEILPTLLTNAIANRSKRTTKS